MHIKRIYLEEADLITELFDQYRVFYKQASDLDLAKVFISERLGNNESVVFVAIENNLPIGFTQLYPKYSSARATRNWILNDLYVKPAYRKTGVGAALIDAAAKFGKNNKATFLQLETAKDNFTAQSLYKAMGFVQQEAQDEFLMFRKAI